MVMSVVPTLHRYKAQIRTSNVLMILTGEIYGRKACAIQRTAESQQSGWLYCLL